MDNSRKFYSELNSPRAEIHFLSFSEIEKNSYRKSNADGIRKMYSSLFQEGRLHNSFKDLKLPRVGDFLNEVIYSCTHPKDESGNLLKFKSNMTMDEIIEEVRAECNNFLHSLIQKHIDIAKMCTGHSTSVDYYTNALRLIEVYKEKKLKIDPILENNLKHEMNAAIVELDESPNSSSNLDFKKNTKKLKKLYQKYSFKKQMATKTKQTKLDIMQCETDLKNKLKTLFYLENTEKEKKNSTEIDSCLICLHSVTKWAVLACGHSICEKCLINIHNNSDEISIICPMCRSNCEWNSIRYVRIYAEGEIPSIKIKGSYSTKIENIVLKFIELIAEDPNVKVLVLTNWEMSLKCLGDALEENSINYKILKPGVDVLNDFETNENINALLLNINFDLTKVIIPNITRVFFMEPIVKNLDRILPMVDQIINKFGHNKTVICHHFIVRDSIENEILSVASSDKYRKYGYNRELQLLLDLLIHRQSLL